VLLFWKRGHRSKLRLSSLLTLLLAGGDDDEVVITVFDKSGFEMSILDSAADFLDPSRHQTIGKRSILRLDTTTNR
jgi:hypothetical protein